MSYRDAYFYAPFVTKLMEWVAYEENRPKSEYSENVQEHDAFRATNDRDCILTGGNLYADTIFSLWLPLRHTIARMHSTEAIREVGDINKKYSFAKSLLEGDNLRKMLPRENRVVRELRRLFGLGLLRCNVMLLTDRGLNSRRGRAPYYDYMPRFLYELFPGGDFSDAFSSEQELVEWIKNENLQMFFDGKICRDGIIDLAGSGDIMISLAPEGEQAQVQMIRRYREILKLRGMYE